VSGYRGPSGSRAAVTRTLPWLAMVGLLAAGGLLMSLTGQAAPLQSAVQGAAAPLTAGMRRLTAPLVDLLTAAGGYSRLQDENRALRAENERLLVELARVREDEVRAADLADLLGIGARVGSDNVTYAAIIARDPSPARDVIQINRGTRDGVQAGMPVLGKGGALVGTVEQAHERVAWVRLLTDPRSGVNAVVQESRALALAVGAPGHGLRMEFLSQEVVVKPGDTVLTSGLGGSYPAGLLIGRVAKVDGGPLEVFQRVQVEPAVRLTALESVAVLTGFRPVPIEGLGR
jgi:rod shape-determining protein MreC